MTANSAMICLVVFAIAIKKDGTIFVFMRETTGIVLAYKELLH